MALIGIGNIEQDGQRQTTFVFDDYFSVFGNFFDGQIRIGVVEQPGFEKPAQILVRHQLKRTDEIERHRVFAIPCVQIMMECFHKDLFSKGIN